MAETRANGLTTGLRAVLVVSLALNLLVVGVAAGWWLRHGGAHHGAHPARLDMAGGPLSRALTREDRREIARGMRAMMKAHGADRTAMQESMAALLAELRTEPFDAATVAARLAAQRATFAERFAMGQAVLVSHLAAMSGPERAAFADRLEAEIVAYGARRRD